MRSHTGGCGTMGCGMFSCMSKKQKLNTRSSTEANLVGVDDVMGTILWCQRFLKGQGRNVKPAVIFQDNQGAILLSKNGGSSSSSRTLHVDVRYYFSTDRVNKGEVIVKYCPTASLCSDVLTKPLQGNQFRRLRAKILNLEYDPSPTRADLDHRSVLEMQKGVCHVVFPFRDPRLGSKMSCAIMMLSRVMGQLWKALVWTACKKVLSEGCPMALWNSRASMARE